LTNKIDGEVVSKSAASIMDY